MQQGYLRHLRRITSSGRYIAEIDGLRFVSLAAILLYHINAVLAHHGYPIDGLLARVIGNCQRGVELFFVISGFVLAAPFRNSLPHGAGQVDIRKYFRRRLTRLEPPYFLCLMIAFVAETVLRRLGLRQLLLHLVASSLYMHNLMYGQLSAINAVSWTLEIEVQFYCLLPLLAYVFMIRSNHRRWAVIGGTMGLVGVLQCLPIFEAWRLKLSLAYYLQYFLGGMLLADIYTTYFADQPKTFGCDVLALACWIVIFSVDTPGMHQVLPVVILLAYIFSLKARLLGTFFTNDLVTIIGGACYSIYLFHFLMIGLLFHWSQHVAWNTSGNWCFLVQGLILIPATLACGMLFYRIVERPCMDPDYPQRAKRWLSEIVFADVCGFSKVNPTVLLTVRRIVHMARLAR